MKTKQNRTVTINEPFIKTVKAFKKFTLNLNVMHFTTDANGIVLANAAIPDNIKKPYPFHLFGNFDMAGSYNIADHALQKVHNTNLFTMFVGGTGMPLFPFNAFATINSKIKKGDVVFVYVDDLDAPNYFTFVIVQSITGAYASLVNQTNTTQLDSQGYWGTFKIFGVKFTWYSDQQLQHPFYLIESKFDSAFKYDLVDPAAYYEPEQKMAVMTTIVPIQMLVNQYMGISSFIAWENALINLSFEIYV